MLKSGFSALDIAWWITVFLVKAIGFPLERYPHLAAWYERLAARPTFAREVAMPAELAELSCRHQAACDADGTGLRQVMAAHVRSRRPLRLGRQSSLVAGREPAAVRPGHRGLAGLSWQLPRVPRARRALRDQRSDRPLRASGGGPTCAPELPHGHALCLADQASIGFRYASSPPPRRVPAPAGCRRTRRSCRHRAWRTARP
ncbi:MAG: hypothetical protein EXQ97_01915 [Alphaproteobacteria bacterium]|nr:hypothetical protein [Alphaproteobacteria bacterium]